MRLHFQNTSSILLKSEPPEMYSMDLSYTATTVEPTNGAGRGASSAPSASSLVELELGLLSGPVERLRRLDLDIVTCDSGGTAISRIS